MCVALMCGDKTPFHASTLHCYFNFVFRSFLNFFAIFPTSILTPSFFFFLGFVLIYFSTIVIAKSFSKIMNWKTLSRKYHTNWQGQKRAELLTSCSANVCAWCDIRYNYIHNYLYSLLNTVIITRSKIKFPLFIYDNEGFLTINSLQNTLGEKVNFSFGFNRVNGSGATWLYVCCIFQCLYLSLDVLYPDGKIIFPAQTPDHLFG